MGFIFRRWAAGPHNFPPEFSMLFRLSPVTLSTGIRFSPKSYLFSRFAPSFTQIFQFFLLFTPIFAVFASGYFIDSPGVFTFLILWDTCSTLMMGLSLRGSDFRTQQPPNIGSLAKTFLPPPPPSIYFLPVTLIVATRCKEITMVKIVESLSTLKEMALDFHMLMASTKMRRSQVNSIHFSHKKKTNKCVQNYL